MSWLLIAITFAGYPLVADFRSKEACDAALQTLVKAGVIRSAFKLKSDGEPNAACVRQA